MSWIINNTLTWYHRFFINVLRCGPIPKHVAFIMDGNRRYATKERVETRVGHTKGFEKLGETLLWCRELGITEVTVYAFSIENFNRSREEVDTLMQLACDKFEKLLAESERLHSNGICIRVVGNLRLIPARLRAHIAKAVLLTRDNRSAFLNIAFAYTSQDEMADAVRVIADGVRKGKLDVDGDVDDRLIGRCMYSGRSTRPDMLIRTSGEVRFSDFLLWQSWNTNVVFHKVLWPDFTIWHLLACVFYYQMHHADQLQVAKLLRYDCKRANGGEVDAFLRSVESNRLTQLELYAGTLG